MTQAIFFNALAVSVLCKTALDHYQIVVPFRITVSMTGVWWL